MMLTTIGALPLLTAIVLASDFEIPVEPVKAFVCHSHPQCRKLMETGYYEARGEPDKGVKAVMKVVINRTFHPKFPNSIKGVVDQPYAFSYLKDGSTSKGMTNYRQKVRIGSLALDMVLGKKDVDIKGSTHYHSTKVSPKWSKKFTKVATIDNHIFYRCTGYC